MARSDSCTNDVQTNQKGNILCKMSRLTVLSNMGKDQPPAALHSVKPTLRKYTLESRECFRAALCICQYMTGIDGIPQTDMNVPVTSC